MKIKPYYPKSILKQPYINGFWNGIITGMGMLLLFSEYKFMAGIALATGFIYFLIFNYD